MFEQDGQAMPAGVAGLVTGPGIGGTLSWVAALTFVLLLAGLAWWTSRPQRASRAQRRNGRLHATKAPRGGYRGEDTRTDTRTDTGT